MANTKERITLRLDKVLLDSIDLIAKSENRSRSSMIAIMLWDAVGNVRNLDKRVAK